MKNFKKIVIIFIIIISIVVIGYILLAKYYECNPIPHNAAVWLLERADGESVEIFGQTITPSPETGGNASGYSLITNTCE